MRRTRLLAAVRLAVLLAAAAPGGGGVHAAERTAAPAAPGASASALPQSIPLRRDAGARDEPGAWATSAVLLTLTAGAGLWAFWRRDGRIALRRREGRVATGLVRISSHPLTPQASVHAVQWRGEEFLLGCTAQGVTLIARAKAACDAEKGA